jgi:hypothetical protein
MGLRIPLAWKFIIPAILVAGGVMGEVEVGAAGEPPSRQAQPTPFLTPTPGPDGQIVYIVQEGDTPWRIAAIAGITLEQLYALNGLQSQDFITPGMRLTLGFAGPVQPTAAPGGEGSPTPPEPTPTAAAGSGEICVLLFQDLNGNARLDEGEPALSGGRISVAQVSGAVVGEIASGAELEGYCFPEIDPGDYNVSAAIPDGYFPTTGMNAPIRVAPGDVQYVQFGAQASAAINGSMSGGSGERSTFLGIVGMALLLIAGGLGYYAAQLNRRTPMSLR